MKRIQILKTGDAISSNGTPYSFSGNILKEIADTYNPQNFKAPVIVSYPAHNTQGIPDKEVHKHEEGNKELPRNRQLAFGTPDYLQVVGSKLYAVFTEITKPVQQVFDWIKDKQILGFSASIYPPDSPANPYPGNHALRHIASCGVDPPAIKGMGVDFAESLSFSASSGEGALDFTTHEVDFGYGNYHITQIMRSLREWYISTYDMETADRLIPSYILDDMAMSGDCSCDMSEGSDYREHLKRSRELLQQLLTIDNQESHMDGKKVKGKDYDEMEMEDEAMEKNEKKKEVDMSELQAEIALLRAQKAEADQQAALAKQALRRSEIQSFTEQLARDGKLLPAQQQAIAVSFGESAEDTEQDLVDHMLSLNEPQYQFFKGWLQGMPVQVEFGEFAGTGTGLPIGEESSSAEIAKRVQAIASEQGISFNEAYRDFIKAA